MCIFKYVHLQVCASTSKYVHTADFIIEMAIETKVTFNGNIDIGFKCVLNICWQNKYTPGIRM